MFFAQCRAIRLADAIDLVEQQARRHGIGADLAQHLAADLELRLIGRIGGVDDEQQQRGLQRFGEGGAERGDQIVRQLLDEADGVGDQHPRLCLRLQRAHRGVQGCEQLVLDQHLAAGERAHQRRLAGVGVADQRDPQLIAASRAALVAVALDILQLHFQLGEAIADLAAIEFEIGLARTGALLPPAARGFPQPRRDVFQARDLDLQLGLAAVRMTMEDLDDDAGPIQHLRAGGALEVAGLARRDFMIDNHEVRLRRRLRIGRARAGIRLVLVGFFVSFLVGVFKTLAGLRLALYRHRSDDAGPAGQRREFLEPPFAEHGAAADRIALLRDRYDDFVAERLHQTAQFLDACRMRDVIDAGNLDGDEDRTRNGRLGVHDLGSPAGLCEPVSFRAPRRNRATAYMDGSPRNDKAAALQRDVNGGAKRPPPMCGTSIACSRR